MKTKFMAAKRAECSTLAAILLAGSLARGQERPDLVIAGGTIITMDDELRVLEGGALVIDGARIVSVLEPGAALPEADERMDASGMLVIPGLVNTHGHVPMSLLRGLADDMKYRSSRRCTTSTPTWSTPSRELT
ncbi:MAG TPA: hypothetical protein VJH87_22080 [Vicinamibacteria bacterium]|nr:hypothetical protein [Vicinamibacteria bacterium]